MNLIQDVISIVHGIGEQKYFTKDESSLMGRFARAERAREDLKEYFALLKEFPEYRKKEFETEEGYFDWIELKRIAEGKEGDFNVVGSKILLKSK